MNINTNSYKDAPLDGNSMLIGNSLSLTLVRRAVQIKPVETDTFRELATKSRVVSFWGHANSVEAASKFAGVDLNPETERPTIVLNADGFPTLGGERFKEIWVISPEFKNNSRPGIGEETASSQIADWCVLKVVWDTEERSKDH